VAEPRHASLRRCSRLRILNFVERGGYSEPTRTPQAKRRLGSQKNNDGIAAEGAETQLGKRAKQLGARRTEPRPRDGGDEIRFPGGGATRKAGRSAVGRGTIRKVRPHPHNQSNKNTTRKAQRTASSAQLRGTRDSARVLPLTQAAAPHDSARDTCPAHTGSRNSQGIPAQHPRMTIGGWRPKLPHFRFQHPS
jgi:hypothetical protein